MNTPASVEINVSDEQLQDRSAIEQVVADAERFQNDPEQFSQLMTEDVVLINVAGIRLIGRDAVYQAMTAGMNTPLAKVTTKNEIGQITFLRPDVALMSGIKHIFAGTETIATESRTARLTLVLTKNQEGWLIASIQNTPIL